MNSWAIDLWPYFCATMDTLTGLTWVWQNWQGWQLSSPKFKFTFLQLKGLFFCCLKRCEPKCPFPCPSPWYCSRLPMSKMGFGITNYLRRLMTVVRFIKSFLGFQTNKKHYWLKQKMDCKKKKMHPFPVFCHILCIMIVISGYSLDNLHKPTQWNSPKYFLSFFPSLFR